MSISREQDRIESKDEVTVDEWNFCWVVKDPADLPPEAKFRTKLFTPFKDQEDLIAKTSTHSTNKAYKAPLLNLKNAPPPDYILKNNLPGSIISQLEAICSGFYKFLGPENVPSVHAVFDYVDEKQGYQPVGVISKFIRHFKTNRADPLTEEDTKVELVTAAIDEEIKKQRKAILDKFPQLFKVLDRSPKVTAGFFLSSLQSAKNWCNSFQPHSAVSIHDYLSNFIKNNVFNERSINDLMDKLSVRYKKTSALIKENVTDPAEIEEQIKHATELETLDDVIEMLQDILDTAIDLNFKFEQLDEIIKQKNIKLAQEKGIKLQKCEDIYLASLNDNSILTEKIDGKLFSAKVKDLKNFRIVKRQAVALVLRYLMQDTDGHNQNMSKDGWIIDFDMAKLRILFRYRDPSMKDKWLRKPTEKTFIITANDILNFPDISNADFYYWVTKNTGMPEPLSSGGSFINIFPENFFTKIDNDVFKNLKRHAIFVPNKYKTLLKYILTDPKMYHHIGMTHLQKTNGCASNELENVLQEMVTDEAEHIAEARRVLIGMPHFQKFMARYGDKVFPLILKEMMQQRDKKIAELAKKPHYQGLVDSLAPEKIYNQYLNIMVECKLESIRQAILKRIHKEPVLALRVSLSRELSKESEKLIAVFKDKQEAADMINQQIEAFFLKIPKNLGNDKQIITELYAKAQSLTIYTSALIQRQPELKTLIQPKFSALNKRSKQFSDKLQAMKLSMQTPKNSTQPFYRASVC